MTRKLIGTALLTFCTLGLLGQTSNTPTPHVKRFVAPVYPALARKGRFQGATTSEIQVRADGTVDSVKVTMAHPFFQKNVKEALQQWMFEPAEKPFLLKVTVEFSLTEGCDKIPVESLTETRIKADLPDSVSVSTCPAAITTSVW